MSHIITGRAWIFGADISTDDILPGRYLDRSNAEAGRFAMSGIDPEFARQVQPGDFIVAGENFGMGSGRENAPAAIKGAGIAAVIAPSFARLFYRNGINMGLPPVIVSDVSAIQPGDTLELDLDARTLRLPDGRVLSIENLTGTSREILAAGGIVPFTRRRLEAAS